MTEVEERIFLSNEVKEAVENLNAAILKARNNGLSVELKTDSCAMTEDTPPLQVRVFQQVDY